MEKTKVKNQSQKNEIPTKGNKSIINSNLTVMKNLFKSVMALFIGAAMFSCQQAEEPTMDQGQAPETRAFGDTPVVAIYVETNDTNPLNAGDYTMSNGKPFAGIVELFASNVRKRTVNGVVEPTLYLIGVASMNSTQTTQFAQILAHAVAKYGLDGIGFDDEYADDYGSTNSTSYSEIITKLHALMPADKLITVFDWGYTGSINAEAKACIDYSYHGYFGTGFYGSGLLEKARWSPVSTNLGGATNPSTLNSLATRAKSQGYGAFMFFNLRRSSQVNPLNMFSATASGLYGLTVTNANGNRAQDWTFVPAGYEINMDEVQ